MGYKTITFSSLSDSAMSSNFRLICINWIRIPLLKANRWYRTTKARTRSQSKGEKELSDHSCYKSPALYPIPHTVIMYLGLRGSSSIFVLSLLIWTFTAFSSIRSSKTRLKSSEKNFSQAISPSDAVITHNFLSSKSFLTWRRSPYHLPPIRFS